MPPVTYTFSVRDNAAFPPGTRKTGLLPTWVFLKRLADNGDISPQPLIQEIAQGQYKFTYDADANGEAAGQIDAGATLANPSDRYLDILLSRDSSRIQAALGPSGAILDLGQSIPAVNAGQTVGDALNAARAGGFGKWTVNGAAVPPELVMYAADGVTVVRTFTLDDAENPSVRT
jgi:hypothetical protein